MGEKKTGPGGEEQARQVRYLILIAAVLGAVIIGYNAFYVPDAELLEPAAAADFSSATAAAPEKGGEAYVPAPVSQAASPSRAPASSAAEKTSAPRTSSAGAPAGSAGGTAGKINLNTATARQLSDGLDGIGDALAARIVAYREQHGGFKTVDELKNVSGIGDKKLEALRGSVTVG